MSLIAEQWLDFFLVWTFFRSQSFVRSILCLETMVFLLARSSETVIDFGWGPTNTECRLAAMWHRNQQIDARNPGINRSTSRFIFVSVMWTLTDPPPAICARSQWSRDIYLFPGTKLVHRSSFLVHTINHFQCYFIWRDRIHIMFTIRPSSSLRFRAISVTLIHTHL